MINRIILFASLIGLINIGLYAQLPNTKFGDVMPYTQISKYKHRINIDKVHSYVIPAYDNDSLEMVYPYPGGEAMPFGIKHDSTRINIVDKGKKIRIKEGNIWLFTIESATSVRLGVNLEVDSIPPGSYIGIYDVNIRNIINDNSIYDHEDINMHFKNYNISEFKRGSKLVIEYFVPKAYIPYEICITDIKYGFR